MKRKRRHDGSLLAGLTVLALGAACGDNIPDGLARGQMDAAPDATVQDAAAEAKDAEVEQRPPVDSRCAAGLSACGEGEAPGCYDFSRDNEHCGSCGQACASGINCQAGTCQQYRCKGALTFKALPYTTVDSVLGPQYLPALGDFDGDGVVDLAGVPDASGTMSLHYGAGDGTFPVRQPVDTTAAHWQAIAGDFDGDGLLDLTTMSATASEVQLSFFNLSTVAVRRGSGTRSAPFGLPTVFPTGPGLASTTLADFDGDGWLDLVTGVWGGFEYRRGQAGGQFAASTPIPAKDGPITFSGFFPEPTAAAADWNGDRILDLIYSAGPFFSGSSVHFQLGHGDGTFDAEIACALQMGSVGDMDHDGRADLISGGFLLLGLDTCNPKKNVVLPDWPENGRSALADLDGDGNLDLVVDGKVSVRVGDGKGGFGRTLSLPRVGDVASSSAAFVFGDLNRDGKLDIVYTQRDGWAVFLNTCQ